MSTTRPPGEPLNARELEILTMITTGATNAEIGRALFVSENTVKEHLRRAFRKLGARDRANAVTIAIARGSVWLPPGSTPAVQR